MAKKQHRFSDELRMAVDDCGMSRYRICMELGIEQSLLSRFMSSRGGLSINTLDALAKLLDLHVSAGKRAARDQGDEKQRTGKGKRKT
jgi:transcriptional regulator with XRE-family HTH domain